MVAHKTYEYEIFITLSSQRNIRVQGIASIRIYVYKHVDLISHCDSFAYNRATIIESTKDKYTCLYFSLHSWLIG